MNLNPISWLKTKDNREALLAVVTIGTALLGGGWFLYDHFTKSDKPEAPAQNISVDGNNNGIIQQGNDNRSNE